MIHYNEEQFKINFPKTNIGKRIISELPDWFNLDYSPVDFINKSTPREQTVTFNVVPFFYIQMLLEKNPKILADIGCGSNFYKKFIPEIHGIDPVENSNVDEVDFFDETFSIGHTNNYDCAMAMNALHFVSLKDISKQLRNFSRIIKPGGRGFVTLNAIRMIEMTDKQDMIQDDQLSTYIKQQVDDALPNVLVYDDYTNGCRDSGGANNSGLNGNIRIVFEKEQ